MNKGKRKKKQEWKQQSQGIINEQDVEGRKHGGKAE